MPIRRAARRAPAPPDPAGAGRARRDALPRRGAPALRLRARAARDRLPRRRRPLRSRGSRSRSRPPCRWTRLQRGRRVRRVHAPAGRDGDVRARAGAGDLRAALPYSEDGDARGVRGDGPVLAALAVAVALPGTLAGDGEPLGADAEAADVRADRRDRRGADDEPARGDRRRAQLGLPLHVDPRRGVLALRAAPARLHRGGGGVHGLADRAVPRPRRRRAGPLQIMYGIDGRPSSRRRSSTTWRGTAARRRCASATARRPAPARHLRRADRLGLPLQQVRRADLARRLDGPDAHRRLGLRQLGPARRGHLGGARRPAALHVLAADVLGRDRARDADGEPARPARRPRRWRQARDAIYHQIMDARLEREKQAFVQHYDTTCSTRASC